jgi:hypothetical protein
MSSTAFRIKRRRVASRRNSLINVPLEWLDWRSWWTDGNKSGITYLHVQGNAAADPDGDYDLATRVFRVYPRLKAGESNRIEMKDGELWWLIP